MKRFLVALAVAAVPICVHAQGFPEKPIRLVVPFAPGGGSDTVGRILAHRMSEALKVPVVVENRPGSTGVIGTEIVARAAPDGYTLLLADAPHAFNQLVLNRVPYDPIKDFVPVSLVATTPLVLAVPVTSGPQSGKDFIAAAKAQPNKLSVGSGGNGSIAHLAQELLKSRTGIEITHVPYKGSGPAINDALAGHIQAVFAPAPGIVPQVQGGKLRALAVTSEKRSRILPDVPTFEEIGVGNFRVYNWYGVLAPARTPPSVVAKLQQTIATALQVREVRERLEAALLEPAAGAPDELQILLDADSKRWATVIKDAGIKPE